MKDRISEWLESANLAAIQSNAEAAEFASFGKEIADFSYFQDGVEIKTPSDEKDEL